MTIHKKQLLESLKMAMPGIETGKTTLQGADTFIFHDGKIITYNDFISVNVPLSTVGLIEETVEGCVKAEEFFRIVSKLPGDEINFAISNKGTWLLKAGKAKVEMTLMNFDFNSRLNGIKPTDDWIKITDDFITGIGSCKMENKTTLSGVYVNESNIISTDGWQINAYNTTNNMKLPVFWLSDNVVNELLKISKLKGVQVQGSWVHFITENNTIFSVKSLQVEKYPIEKINRIINVSNPKETDFHAKFPKELFNAIDRAVSFGINIDGRNTVRLVLSKDNIEVSSERNAGKYVEKVSWTEELKEFEPITVYVDAVMMQFMAAKTLEFYVQKITENLSRLLFVTPNSTHLMATFNNSN